MKLVNSAAQSGYGIESDMPLTNKHCSGVHTLTVVPLYDFNLFLRIYFMRKFKVAPIPHLEGLIFMGEKDLGS